MYRTNYETECLWSIKTCRCFYNLFLSASHDLQITANKYLRLLHVFLWWKFSQRKSNVLYWPRTTGRHHKHIHCTKLTKVDFTAYILFQVHHHPVQFCFGCISIKEAGCRVTYSVVTDRACAYCSKWTCQDRTEHKLSRPWTKVEYWVRICYQNFRFNDRDSASAV